MDVIITPAVSDESYFYSTDTLQQAIKMFEDEATTAEQDEYTVYENLGGNIAGRELIRLNRQATCRRNIGGHHDA